VLLAVLLVASRWMELVTTRPDDVVGVGESEGDAEQPRLADMAVVLVDDGDVGISPRKGASQMVGGQRPTGSAVQDHHAMCHQ